MTEHEADPTPPPEQTPASEPTPPADPTGIDEPHDVLAAEEFGIGTRDQRFPGDPTGTGEPHDVLAAEEFAMPAGVEDHDQGSPFDTRTLIPGFLFAALLGVLWVRRRNR